MPRVHSLNNPAQQADPDTQVACDEAAMGQACRAVTATPSDPNESSQRNCDTNIVANAATSCGLAENAFYEYYESSQGPTEAIMVHSPATQRDYELFCSRERELVGCVSSPLSDDIYVSFDTHAIDAYTVDQADAYARSRDVGDPGVPAARRAEASLAGSEEQESEVEEPEVEEPNEHSDDRSFCSTHECVGEYETEPGTVVECADGSFSHAGGISGACSHHGGER
ncbi:MAG TPA: hypothetical protein VL988_05790 [Solirubrobacteraceae bacterium]|nr:hypothetical protein [Solirubrobacteraceae bacterium]